MWTPTICVAVAVHYCLLICTELKTALVLSSSHSSAHCRHHHRATLPLKVHHLENR